MIDIVITANSPGEVAAWVKPVVKEIKQIYKNSQIHVFLPPCMFASGSEKDVLKDYTHVDTVFDKNQYLKYVILNRKPAGFSPGHKGIVIFLGGDLFHAVILGKKLNYPVVAYTEGVYNWGSKIDKFMVPDKRTENKLLAKGADKNKVIVIGNLMLDAVEPGLSREELNEIITIDDYFTITLFPGSRPAEVDYMLPFFMESIMLFLQNRTEDRNKFRIFLSRSPFVSEEQLSSIFSDFLDSLELKGNYVHKENYDILRVYDSNRGSDNTSVEIYSFASSQYTLMQVTDLAVTIPGTNNLELASFGTPMLVLLPLNKPEGIPLEGPLGMIGQIPVLGTILKRIFIPRMAEKIKYFSLINRIADEKIAAEIKGVLKPSDLVREIEYLIDNKVKLNDMSYRLKEVAGEKGAAKSLCQIVNQVLFSYH
ncbi:MAG: hypothetical protein ACOCQW_05425 [Halanaerobiaceae bacterium]